MKFAYGWMLHSESKRIFQLDRDTAPGSFSNWSTARQSQQNDLFAQWRLRSAWASAQVDQSLLCPHEDTLGP